MKKDTTVIKKLDLYINTVKYLKPSQVYFRFENKVKRKLYKKGFLRIKPQLEYKVSFNQDFLIKELDFKSEYLSRFDLEEILNNQFVFISIKNKLEDLSTSWNNDRYQHLWRYNLHYFEYLYKLAFEFKKTENNNIYLKYKELLSDWINHNPIGSGDGWHPYTISLRLVNLVSTYKIFSNEIGKDKTFEKMLLDSIYQQYTYLQANTEKDVLGNHYFENIKAILITSLFFQENNVTNRYIRELKNQVEEQILDDGMHFELSPMYHKIILEGLMKVTVWLKDYKIKEYLLLTIKKMLDVMFSLEDDFGKTPSFNDSASGVSKSYETLLNASLQLFNLKPVFKKDLNESGYYISIRNNFKLIFDVGKISPSFLPAHGHCDALSYELSVNNKPLIVNSGTFKYGNNNEREYFRSTKSHNTVTINAQEQSQCWSSFRVAKRIRNLSKKRCQIDGIEFMSGEYTSYKDHRHTRHIGILDNYNILVIDSLPNCEHINASSYIHFVPGTTIKKNKSDFSIKNSEMKIKIFPFNIKKRIVENGYYSELFNVKDRNKHIVLKKQEKKSRFGYLISFNSINFEIEENKNTLIVKNKESNIVIDLEVLDKL